MGALELNRAFVGCVAATALGGAAAATPVLNAATLPGGRAAQSGGPPVTIFAIIVNSGTSTATNCAPSIAPESAGLPLSLSYQTTNSLNQLTGTPNTPANITGGGAQNFLLSFQATGPFDATSVILDYSCDNGSARGVEETNSVILSASSGPVAADIIPIAVTPSADGVVRIGAVGGQQIMATAATNFVSGAANIQVVPEWPGLEPAASLFVQETDALGNPLSPPQEQLTTTISGGGQISFFTVLAVADDEYGVTFRPGETRPALSFYDNNGTLVGRTSAAIEAPAPDAGVNPNPAGLYSVVFQSDGEPITFDTDFNVIGFKSGSGTGEFFGINFFDNDDDGIADYDAFTGDYTAGSPTPGQSLTGFGSVSTYINQDEEGLDENFSVMFEAGPTFSPNTAWRPLEGIVARYTIDDGADQGDLVAAIRTDGLEDVVPSTLSGNYDVVEVSFFDEPIGSATVSATGNPNVVTFAGSVTVGDPEFPETCAFSGTLTKDASGANVFDLTNAAFSGCASASNFGGGGFLTLVGDESAAPAIAVVVRFLDDGPNVGSHRAIIFAPAAE